MAIKQSVINTFNRVGIPYKDFLAIEGTCPAMNRFSGEIVETTPLVAFLIQWVYNAQNDVAQGKVRISDFDRIRYFVLAEDSKAYMTCLD